MRTNLKNVAPVVLTALLATSFLIAGCGPPRYHDTYYHDYHPASGEIVYYNNWERDTHRDHVDLKRRNAKDQKEYWDWRHNQH